MTTIRNLTPHEVTICDPVTKAVVRRVPAEGLVPRCNEQRDPCGDVDGVAVHVVRFGQVHDLPEPEPDTILIVSQPVAAACPDRRDLIFPDRLVRDEAGAVIGCAGFGCKAGLPIHPE